MKIFFILPNQLFKPDKKLLEKFDKIYLYEHPLFFGCKERIQNFNKKKIILHRASMKNYRDELKSLKIKSKYIDYIDYPDYYKFYKKYFLKKDTISFYDPVDTLLLDGLKKHCKKEKIKLEILESPNFVCTRKDLDNYLKFQKEKKVNSYKQTSFYAWNRKRLGLLQGKKLSYDKENRKSLPKNFKLPKDDNYEKINLKNKNYRKAVKYTQKYFSKNCGDLKDFYFPITREDSEKWFKHFLKQRLSHFGDYEDSIHLSENKKNNHVFLFHSGLAPLLNIGLLDPNEIIKKAIKYYKKKNIPVNQIEGFIRQIIGWREYIRLVYINHGDKIRKCNYFNHKNKLTDKWYDGTTGIIPLDKTIQKAFKYGYIHHIERLMIVANFMNLSGIKPDEVYKWFMEFSLDSYDWVMIANVYSMALYADGNLITTKGKDLGTKNNVYGVTTKPYLSSSNYIIKMGVKEKDKKWAETWDCLYWNFLKVNKKKLESNKLMKYLLEKNIKKKGDKFFDECKKVYKKFIKNNCE